MKFAYQTKTGTWMLNDNGIETEYRVVKVVNVQCVIVEKITK